jgi:hypothetical protein
MAAKSKFERKKKQPLLRRRIGYREACDQSEGWKRRREGVVGERNQHRMQKEKITARAIDVVK